MENETEKLDMRPLLLKRFVWDVFPHDIDAVREAQQNLGLVPDGEGGMEIEHDASDTRVLRVAPLRSTLRTLSGLVAEVVGLNIMTFIREEAEELEIPEGFTESFANQNSEIIYESSYAILCHLMDTGVLSYGEKVRG